MNSFLFQQELINCLYAINRLRHHIIQIIISWAYLFYFIGYLMLFHAIALRDIDFNYLESR